MKKENVNVKELVMTAIWIAVVAVVTWTSAIPILPQGYLNLGDAAVFLGVFLLGRKNGTIAAGIGSGLADLLAGFTAFAPFTLVIKAGMALIFGTFLMHSAGRVDQKSKKLPASHIMGIGIAAVFMSAGYYFAEMIITGNKIAPIISIPWNILQGAVGGALALLLIVALGSIRMPGSRKKEEKEASSAKAAIKEADSNVEEVEAEIVDPVENFPNEEESK